MDNEIKQITVEEQNERLKAGNTMLLSDMKLLKDSVFKILSNLNLLEENGTIREHISVTSLVPKVMKYAGNKDALKKDFAFLKELMPLLEKYQAL